jgi:hypothetical protein
MAEIYSAQTERILRPISDLSYKPGSTLVRPHDRNSLRERVLLRKPDQPPAQVEQIAPSIPAALRLWLS